MELISTRYVLRILFDKKPLYISETNQWKCDPIMHGADDNDGWVRGDQWIEWMMSDGWNATVVGNVNTKVDDINTTGVDIPL